MEKVFNVGDFVEATIDVVVNVVGNERFKHYKGIIVEIFLGKTGMIAIIEQKDGVRKHLHVNHLKFTEGELFFPTYFELGAGKKVKAKIKYSDDKFNQFEGIIKSIIPYRNYGSLFYDLSSSCSQAIIVSEDGKEHNCALGHLYPIDFVSKEIL